MNEKNISASILESYRPLEDQDLDLLLNDAIKKDNHKIIVLDDDPTGVQTVHDISVYTDWDIDSIRKGFQEENKLFYILTNSRGFTAGQTKEEHEKIAQRIAQVAKELGQDYLIISRSDSTLRGHYPLETETLAKVMQEESGNIIDGEILSPFFKEGGRFTIDDVHYVQYGDELVPAGNTEFAQDKTFGYSASNIKEYIEEKTQGAYKKEDVISIALDDLRNENIEKIVDQLLKVEGFNKIVLNAIDYADLKVFCRALYEALQQDKHFMFRSAAGLVKVIGGITDQPLLTREDMITEETDNGGIIVVGSHTKMTTDQLNELLKLEDVVPIEFHSDLVLEGEDVFNDEVNRVVTESEALIKEGKTPVCFTNRKLLTVEDDTKEKALMRSVMISDGVQNLVGRLEVKPAFIIAKGGITSSDIGTKALGVKRANVMGQIRPGIPVWQTDEVSKFPGIPYIIFPGNVGQVSTLREAAEILLNK